MSAVRRNLSVAEALKMIRSSVLAAEVEWNKSVVPWHPRTLMCFCVFLCTRMYVCEQERVVVPYVRTEPFLARDACACCVLLRSCNTCACWHTRFILCTQTDTCLRVADKQPLPRRCAWIERCMDSLLEPNCRFLCVWFFIAFRAP